MEHKKKEHKNKKEHHHKEKGPKSGKEMPHLMETEHKNAAHMHKKGARGR